MSLSLTRLAELAYQALHAIGTRLSVISTTSYVLSNCGDNNATTTSRLTDVGTTYFFDREVIGVVGFDVNRLVHGEYHRRG